MSRLQRFVCATVLACAAFVTPLLGTLPAHPDHPGHIEGIT